ncbi:MAG TPA: rhodanese-like domain-containing protein [Verrucomicrobiales bacterium]|nr:rhodanese-like domain-containing protein [Verrucomicrobiales bacterium]
MNATAALNPDMTMSDLLEAMPGARRALFAKYHIGGCSSCGFSPAETVAEVCRRNDNIDPAEMLAHLEASAEQDARMQVSPQELSAMLQDGAPLRLIDVRSREEHEAVKLPGSELMTQEVLQKLFGESDKSQRIVVYCHHGVRSLDSAAYLAGHGFTNVRSLAGGIDAWSCEVDQELPRYRLEME